MEGFENFSNKKFDLETFDGKSFTLVFEAKNSSISLEYINNLGYFERINLPNLPIKSLEMFETMNMAKINKLCILLQTKFDFNYWYVEEIHDRIKELLMQI